jgi:WD40 repeat protein/nucleoside phosphorylase
MPLEDTAALLDVCIVCALADEARAFLQTVAQRCQVPIEERISPQHRYDYRFATIENHKKEPLTLHVSWLPRYGPQEMVLHLTHVIEEFQPRMACMTGICAGDRVHVARGDLVVAERTFSYDQGAFVTDEYGRQVHQHDTLTYQIEENLLRFLQFFASWEALLSDLQYPAAEPHPPTVHCHIKPLASGSAVRRDNPFQDIQVPVRGAIAIDMEGAAFGRVMSSHPPIPWLIVKGVSDYADVEKDDSYHDYAMHAAALYALSVLQAYVTSERLPKQHRPGVAQTTPAANDASEQAGVSNGAPYAAGTITMAQTAASLEQATRAQSGRLSPPHKPGAFLRRYDAHASWVLAVAWEPTGTRIASAGADGTVRIWEAETGESLLTYRGHTHLLNTINIHASISTIAWSPDGGRMASAGSGTKVHIWDAATGQILTLYQGHSGLLPDVWTAAWSPDGKQVASVCSSIGIDKTIHIWDAASGQTLKRYDVRANWLPNLSVPALAWSSDGTRLAAACGDRTIRIWDSATDRLTALHHFRAQWSSDIAWSPDQRYLASAHSDHTVQIWETDAPTARSVMTYHGHTDAVRCVAWSPDGAYLASAAHDCTVRIWETRTGKHVYTYQGHTGWVTAVSWSSTGTHLASASNDKTVLIWQREI